MRLIQKEQNPSDVKPIAIFRLCDSAGCFAHTTINDRGQGQQSRFNMVTKPFLNIWDEACAERAAETVASAFEEDALYRAILLTTDSLCNDAKISTERRAEYLIPRIREKMRRGALLVEAGNWAAVALWCVY